MNAPALRTIARRVLAVVVVAFFGFAGLLVIEVLMARGGPNVAGYSREELDGLIGSGPGEPLRVTWIERLLDGVAAVHPEHVIVLGIGEFASTPRFAQPLRFIAGVRGHQLDTDLRNAAHRHGALYVDIAGRVGSDFVRDPLRYHSADRYHPSDAGYGLWAKATL